MNYKSSIANTGENGWAPYPNTAVKMGREYLSLTNGNGVYYIRTSGGADRSSNIFYYDIIIGIDSYPTTEGESDFISNHTSIQLIYVSGVLSLRLVIQSPTYAYYNVGTLPLGVTHVRIVSDGTNGIKSSYNGVEQSVVLDSGTATDTITINTGISIGGNIHARYNSTNIRLYGFEFSIDSTKPVIPTTIYDSTTVISGGVPFNPLISHFICNFNTNLIQEGSLTYLQGPINWGTYRSQIDRAEGPYGNARGLTTYIPGINVYGILFKDLDRADNFGNYNNFNMDLVFAIGGYGTEVQVFKSGSFRIYVTPGNIRLETGYNVFDIPFEVYNMFSPITKYHMKVCIWGTNPAGGAYLWIDGNLLWSYGAQLLLLINDNEAIFGNYGLSTTLHYDVYSARFGFDYINPSTVQPEVVFNEYSLLMGRPLPLPLRSYTAPTIPYAFDFSMDGMSNYANHGSRNAGTANLLYSGATGTVSGSKLHAYSIVSYSNSDIPHHQSYDNFFIDIVFNLIREPSVGEKIRLFSLFGTSEGGRPNYGFTTCYLTRNSDGIKSVMMAHSRSGKGGWWGDADTVHTPLWWWVNNDLGITRGKPFFFRITNNGSANMQYSINGATHGLEMQGLGNGLHNIENGVTSLAEYSSITLGQYIQFGGNDSIAEIHSFEMGVNTNKVSTLNSLDNFLEGPPQPIYKLYTSPVSTVNEGASISIYGEAFWVAEGTVLYITISGLSNSDWSHATQGNAPIATAVGSNFYFSSVSISLTADATTEGIESMTVELRSGSGTGPIVATAQVSVQDTSIERTYSLQLNSSQGSGPMNEDSGYIYIYAMPSVNTTETLTIEYGGTAVKGVDFIGPDTLQVYGQYWNSPSPIIATSDQTTEGTEYLNITLKDANGTVVGSFLDVPIYDTSKDPLADLVLPNLSAGSTNMIDLDLEGNLINNVGSNAVAYGSIGFLNGAVNFVNAAVATPVASTYFPEWTLEFCIEPLSDIDDEITNNDKEVVLLFGGNGGSMLSIRKNGSYPYLIAKNFRDSQGNVDPTIYYIDAGQLKYDDPTHIRITTSGTNEITFYKKSSYGNYDQWGQSMYLSGGNGIHAPGHFIAFYSTLVNSITNYMYWYRFRPVAKPREPSFNLVKTSLLSDPEPKFEFWFSDNAGAWGFRHIATGIVVMDFAPFCPNFDYDPSLYIFNDGTMIVGHYGGQAYKIDIHGNVLGRHTPFYAESVGWEDEYMDQNGLYRNYYGVDTNGNEGDIGYFHLSKNFVQTKVITGLAYEVDFPFPGLQGPAEVLPTFLGIEECYITGNVSKENVGPVEGAKVVWVSDQGYPLQRTTTDASGNYTLYFMSTTPKRILVTHPTLGCLVHGGVPTVI